jgi:hypothetical protein
MGGARREHPLLRESGRRTCNELFESATVAALGKDDDDGSAIL